MTITARIDAITHLPPERLATVIPAPRSVKIELTGRCNFNCMFCARGDGLREQKDMDQAFFNRIIREMRAAGVEELGLFYLGESMLCPWLAEAVAEAKAVGFPYVFLTTNGSLATRAKCEALFRAGLDSLKFSFNYADETQFARVTRVKASLYEKVRANVHAARIVRDKVEAETGHRCGLYASYIQYDGEQAAAMEETAAWLGQFVDEVYALPLYNQAGLCKQKLQTDAEEWAQTAGNMGRIGGLVAPLPCWALFSEGHISWNRALTGCCFSHVPDFDFGNLDEMSFLEAWNSSAAQALRKASLSKDVRGPPCEHCVAYTA